MRHPAPTREVPLSTEQVLQVVVETAGLLFYDIAGLNTAPASGTVAGDWIFFQSLGGTPPLIVGYELPAAVVTAIAGTMLQTTFPKVDELALDASSELLNTIVGNAAARLARSGARLAPSPPRWVPARGALPFSVDTRVPLRCEAGVLAILVGRP